MKTPLAIILLLFCVCTAPGAQYYVDSRAGDDARSGASPEQAWKSLARVNATVFQPGDQVLLKSGSRFIGQLKPQGSGVVVNGKVAPILLGEYGEGPLPLLEGGGVLDALLLRNVEYWEVQDLEISNLGTNRQAWRTGVHISDEGAGPLRHLYLRRLYVRDVNGDLRKEAEGCGIYFDQSGGNDSRFDDLRIEDCHVVRADRNGICQRASNRARSLGVVIRANLLEDIGGDGIKLWGSNGGLIESNVVRGGRMRCADYAAGIWPFDCDDTVIQFNEVSGMKGTRDGEGFDADYQCRRSLFQYNYSHDNDGGFILVCTPGNSYNLDTVIRYNISQRDGINAARVIDFGGGARNTWFYNNTIYLGAEQKLPLLVFGEWSGGNANGAKFYNNLFYVEGQASYEWGKSANLEFDCNLFYGGIQVAPSDAHAITNRPPLRQPGSGGQGFDTLRGYAPQPGASLPRGRLIPDNGGRDFFGASVSSNSPASIGAVE